MRRPHFHRLGSILLLLGSLGVFADSGRADPLDPGSDPSDPTAGLALRGGRLSGTELRAFVYAAAPGARSQLAVKLDGVAQPSLTVQTFKEAREPLDVIAVIQIDDWSRGPQLKELKAELVRLSDEVYGALGGRMGLVAYNRKLTCFPQEGGLDGTSRDFAGSVQALDGFMAAEDSEGGHDTANALDCAFDRFGKAATGRARVLLLFTNGADKNDLTEQPAVFKRKAGLARQNAISIITILMPGTVQGSSRLKPPFEQILSQSTGGHLIAVPAQQPLSHAVGALRGELANLLLVSGSLSLGGSAPVGPKHTLTLAVQARSLSREVVLSPAPAAAAAPPPAPTSQVPRLSREQAPTPPIAPELAPPLPMRKGLSLVYAALALFGLAVFLGISLRKATPVAAARLDPMGESKAVLAAVPRRPSRTATPSRAAEWMGGRADRLLAEGAAWLYSPRTRRTYLLAKLPVRLGNMSGSDIILRIRGLAAGCEFKRDPHTGRLVAQPLTEQSLEIEGQRISHSTPLTDRIRLRIGSEEFQFFEVRTGAERVA